MLAEYSTMRLTSDSGKKLTATQIETLKRWVEQGAKYQAHWSLIAPQRHKSLKRAGTKAGHDTTTIHNSPRQDRPARLIRISAEKRMTPESNHTRWTPSV